MSLLLISTIIVLAVAASLLFSTLTYSLRDFSRSRLSEYLEVRGKMRRLEPILSYREDLIFITAAWRLVANVIILLGMLRLFAGPTHSLRAEYFMATIATLLVTLVCSIAIPHAAARYAGDHRHCRRPRGGLRFSVRRPGDRPGGG